MIRWAVNAYAIRDAVLAEMGYATYAEYLGGELWAMIRGRVYALSRRCCCCKGRATELHHCSYDRSVLVGDDDRYIVPICRECHEDAEFDKHGAKRSMAEVQRHLLPKLRQKYLEQVTGRKKLRPRKKKPKTAAQKASRAKRKQDRREARRELDKSKRLPIPVVAAKQSGENVPKPMSLKKRNAIKRKQDKDRRSSVPKTVAPFTMPTIRPGGRMV